MGLAYCIEDYVDIDYKEALKWYTKAADKDNVDAKYDIGKMYLQAYGVKKNYRETLSYFIKAAAQGHKEVYSLIEKINSEFY